MAARRIHEQEMEKLKEARRQAQERKRLQEEVDKMTSFKISDTGDLEPVSGVTRNTEEVPKGARWSAMAHMQDKSEPIDEAFVRDRPGASKPAASSSKPTAGGAKAGSGAPGAKPSAATNAPGAKAAAAAKAAPVKKPVGRKEPPLKPSEIKAKAVAERRKKLEEEARKKREAIEAKVKREQKAKWEASMPGRGRGKKESLASLKQPKVPVKGRGEAKAGAAQTEAQEGEKGAAGGSPYIPFSKPRKVNIASLKQPKYAVKGRGGETMIRSSKQTSAAAAEKEETPKSGAPELGKRNIKIASLKQPKFAVRGRDGKNLVAGREKASEETPSKGGPPVLGKKRDISIASLKAPKIAVKSASGGTMFAGKKDEDKPWRKPVSDRPADDADVEIFTSKPKVRMDSDEVISNAREVADEAMKSVEKEPEVAVAVLEVADAATDLAETQPEMADVALNVASGGVEVAGAEPGVAEIAVGVAGAALNYVKAAEDAMEAVEVGDPQLIRQATANFDHAEAVLTEAEKDIGLAPGSPILEDALIRAEFALEGASSVVENTAAEVGVALKKYRRRKMSSYDMAQLEELYEFGRTDVLLHPDIPTILNDDPEGANFYTCSSVALLARDCQKDVRHLRNSYALEVVAFRDICYEIIAYFEKFMTNRNPERYLIVLRNVLRKISHMDFYQLEGSGYRLFAKECYFLHVQQALRKMLESHPDPSVVAMDAGIIPEYHEMAQDICASSEEYQDDPSMRHHLIESMLCIARLTGMMKRIDEVLLQMIKEQPEKKLRRVKAHKIMEVHANIKAIETAIDSVYPSLARDFCWFILQRSPITDLNAFPDSLGFVPKDTVNRILAFQLHPGHGKFMLSLWPHSSFHIPTAIMNAVMAILTIQYRFYNYHGFQDVDGVAPYATLSEVKNKNRIIQILPNEKHEWFCVTTMFGGDQHVFTCYGATADIDKTLQTQMGKLVGQSLVQAKQGWISSPLAWRTSDVDAMPSAAIIPDDLTWKPVDSGAIAVAAAVALCEGMRPNTCTLTGAEARKHLADCLDYYRFTLFPKCS